jgi:Glycosyl hydrolase catalytic core
MKLRRLATSLALIGFGAIVALWTPGPARASPQIDYGVQDDAWLLYGGGTVDSRVKLLQRLGVDVVRFTIRWDHVGRRRAANARNHRSSAYDWQTVDPVLRGLRRHGIDAVVTLLGTPRWANGGRAFNWAPTSSRSFADFAYATAKRYPWVRKWTIWNEPNQARWLRPTSAAIYVARLLNPAYAQLHAATRGVRVAGGVTAPRASSGGYSPVAWIRGMGAAGARLDAYAHHPYPLKPRTETPWDGGCVHCSTITMADLERLLQEVRRSFGAKPIWLTEYGYQTNPPDRVLGVSPGTQARHVASASHRAYLAPYVDMLIHFLVRDDTLPSGWQSGLFTSGGIVKPAYWAYRMPVTQVRRRGGRVDVWGQIRPRSGRQQFRVRLFEHGSWRSLGGARWTNERGFFGLTVRARPGALLQVRAAGEHRPSVALSLQ